MHHPDMRMTSAYSGTGSGYSGYAGHDHEPYTIPSVISPAFVNSSFYQSANFNLLTLVDVGDTGEGSVVKAGIIAGLTFLIITLNVLIFGALAPALHSHSMIGYFILSLAGVDLATGVLIAPLSIFPALYGYWPYGPLVCKLTAFLEITLWAIAVYTLGWIGVDRYLAIRKPSRYETIQTKIRCQCWVVFTWITSIFLCSPTFFAHNKVSYIGQVQLCILDLHFMLAYSITLLSLILGPTICTLCFCYYYVLKEMAELKRDVKDQEKEALTSTTENLYNPTHRMSFVVIVAFALAWLPWFLLLLCQRVLPFASAEQAAGWHFGCVWFGISGCAWKFPVYCAMSRRFRRCLAQFLWSLCLKCRFRKSLEDDSASID
ncbi:G-protein coupled receptor 52-like [Paramacrobiotus metropolitanus]|uniref:G-protein coupled receptor 52-like n=1 Tax=Paramacrobiotus metropolitanus TaxID=2943436 RepID=UPI00244563F8|nr:G-protein coupled receptor 52-like [Paramacrobiotus metropolitanus]